MTSRSDKKRGGLRLWLDQGLPLRCGTTGLRATVRIEPPVDRRPRSSGAIPVSTPEFGSDAQATGVDGDS